MKSKNNPLTRLTVTLSKPLAQRLAALREQYDFSVSVIAEIAITNYLGARDDKELGEELQAAGAVRRRSRERSF